MGADNFDPTTFDPAANPAAEGMSEIPTASNPAMTDDPQYAGQQCMFADICEDETLCKKLQRDEKAANEMIEAKKQAGKNLYSDLINKQYDEISSKWLEFLAAEEPAVEPYERKFVYTVNGATKIFEKVIDMLEVLGLKVAGTTVEGSVTF